MIEKHFILSREDGGVDSKFSLNKEELEELTKKLFSSAFAVAPMEEFERSPREKESLKFRRSLYFARDMEAGELVEASDIRRVRPGFGMQCREYNSLIGERITKSVHRGIPVSKAYFIHDAGQER